MVQTATIVDPSEAMRLAILNDAHSVVLLHNHPLRKFRSPSQADIQLTRRLYEAGRDC